MADTFTPEQIAQILEEFFKTVGTRQYKGMRYVPLFGRKDEDSIEWDNSAPYEPLTVVLYQGNSFTSRQYVPTGVEITNEAFWALTFNFNAQVELYRRETREALEVANAVADALPATYFNAQNTVKDQIDALGDKLPVSAFDGTTIADYIDDAIDALGDKLPVSAFEGTTVADYIDDAIAEERTRQAGFARRLFNLDRPHFMGWLPCSGFPTRRPASGCAMTANRWVQCFSSDTNDGSISIVDFTTNTLINSAIVPIGHANGCCYVPDSNMLYVAVGRYGASSNPNYTNDILAFSIDYDDQAINYVRTYSPSWQLGGENLYIKGIGYDEVTNKIVVNTRYGAQLGVFNPDDGSISNTVTVERTLPSQAPQTIACRDGFVYMLLAEPNAIVTYELSTGAMLGVDVFGMFSDIDISIRECEGLCFFDGILYACAYFGNPVGTDCFVQVLSCQKPNEVRHYTYVNALYINRNATVYSGRGESAQNALPFVNLINEYAANLTTLYIAGDYEGYGSNNDISIRNGCQIGRIDFTGASNITRMDFLGMDHVYITGLTLKGRPVARNSALYFASCGDVVVASTSFEDSELNANDIALNAVSSLYINRDVTGRADDTIHVTRSTNCPVFTILAAELVSITGSTPRLI